MSETLGKVDVDCAEKKRPKLFILLGVTAISQL